MNSAFGEVFLFLTNLAWKSRVTIPILVTTVFLIMDIRLQIEINIQSGQVAAAEFDHDDTDDDIDDYTTDSTDNEAENHDDEAGVCADNADSEDTSKLSSDHISYVDGVK